MSERILIPRSDSAVDPQAFDYLMRQASVLPTSRDVLGGTADEASLREIITRYDVTEWLSFLARVQTALAAYRMQDMEYRQRVFSGALGPRLQQAINSWSTDVAKRGTRPGLFYERQLATLQQFAMLHAPRTGSRKLETDDGRDDLGIALLITADLMMRHHRASDPEEVLAAMIHSQIRMSLLPAAHYAGRAYAFYELAAEKPSVGVQQYFDLFKVATGQNAAQFILGGLAIAMHEEIRLMNDEYEGWHPVPTSSNTVEAECIRAYLAVRCSPLESIAVDIRRFEKDRDVADWNLIAISASPIVRLNANDYTLNLTAVGRSLFDGIRHEILTASIEERLPDPWNDRGQAAGGLYGTIFERYVKALLEQAFPGRVHRVDETNEERADFVILFDGIVVVLEVKARHFLGLDHAAFKTLFERQEEINAIDIPKALRQIESTIRALRSGTLRVPGLDPDWTSTPIVPVVVTDERLPQIARCWDHLYAPLMHVFSDLQTPGGEVAPFRLLALEDVEIIEDIRSPYDFARLCLRWANDPDLRDSMLPAYLAARGLDWRNDQILSRYQDVTIYLAEKLGLDAELLRRKFVGPDPVSDVA